MLFMSHTKQRLIAWSYSMNSIEILWATHRYHDNLLKPMDLVYTKRNARSPKSKTNPS